MDYCPNPRGTLIAPDRRYAMASPCGCWGCTPCGRHKARKVSARFAKLRPDYLMTLSLPRSAWATRANVRELQTRCRWLLRYMKRHGLLEAYGWVREEGAPRAECVCSPGLDGCICGANGRQLHRHFLLRLAGAANRFGRRWLPYAKLQETAKRCGLGTLDFRPVHSGEGAARYVSKYLFKSVGVALGHARRYAMTESHIEPPSPGWAWSPGRVALVAVELLGAAHCDWDAVRWAAPSG